MKHQQIRFLIAVTSFSAGIAFQAASADAAITISQCNQGAASSDLVLDPAGAAIEITYDHDDPPCVTVQDGHSFDMKGYKIRCVPGAGHTTCAQPAVKCTGSSLANAKVEDTVAGTNDHDSNHVNIEGPATTGVLDCGTVQKLKIDGPLTGIAVSGNNGKSYQKNVIWPAVDGTGMNLELRDNTDRVFDNRIDGGNFGIKVVGKTTTTGPQIDHNVIRGFDVNGIYNADSTYMRFQDNVVVEGGESSVPFLIGSANATFTDNVCEVGGPCACELDFLTPETAVNPPSNCF
ncbi:MAG: hypothetical protein LC667_16655 [Thioalkalivibrio sp.]|nr:hypothetical protein [Thioalkalivibrio sp.]